MLLVSLFLLYCGSKQDLRHDAANIVAIPIFVELNTWFTLSVNFNPLIINYAKLAMQLT